MERNGQIQKEIDRRGQKQKIWIDMDRSRKFGQKYVDRNGLIWIEVDRNRQIWIEMDRFGQKWIEMDKSRGYGFF